MSDPVGRKFHTAVAILADVATITAAIFVGLQVWQARSSLERTHDAAIFNNRLETCLTLMSDVEEVDLMLRDNGSLSGTEHEIALAIESEAFDAIREPLSAAIRAAEVTALRFLVLDTETAGGLELPLFEGLEFNGDTEDLSRVVLRAEAADAAPLDSALPRMIDAHQLVFEACRGLAGGAS